MTDRLPHYSDDRLMGWRYACDGSKRTWLAQWQAKGPDCCGECDRPYDEAPELYDSRELPFHLGPIKSLPGDMERCNTCREEWENVGAVLSRVYSAAAIAWTVNRDAPFRAALRKR